MTKSESICVNARGALLILWDRGIEDEAIWRKALIEIKHSASGLYAITDVHAFANRISA